MSVIEIKVPAIGESITEVTLSQWLKKDGDFVQVDEPICEFESDKATLELPAEKAGKLIIVAAEGDDLEIGALVAKIDTSVKGGAPKKDAPKDESPKVEAVKTEAPASKETYASGHPSPAAAKILAEKGISASDVKGTGKDGRITKEDAEKAVKTAQAVPTKVETSTTPSTGSTSFSRDTSRSKMSRMRRTIAKRLVSAKNNTAMLTTFNEVDLTEIMKVRSTHQEAFVKKYGVKLGYMSLFTTACAIALMDMPQVNSIIDGDELIAHNFADISIAVSTPTGLVVPVIRNAESLGFHEIELKIKELAGKARDGKLTLAEMTGGTFTITNGGVFGSMMSTPIINEPQSAILGMHTIQERAMVVNGEIKIRKMMYIALSYDHRVIDGSASVTFLVKVKQMLENPVKMLLGL